MSQVFWLATLPIRLDALRARADVLNPALRDAIEDGFANALAIELIQDDTFPQRLALLVSVADAADLPKRLTCWMAYSNDAGWCDLYRRHGVAMIESRLTLGVNGNLSVNSPLYPERKGSDPVSLCDHHVLTIRGIALDPDDHSTKADTWAPTYVQAETSPDVARQTQDLQASQAQWTPPRRSLRPLDPDTARLTVAKAVWPDLGDILRSGGFYSLWTGRQDDAGPLLAPAPNTRSYEPTPGGGPANRPANRPKIKRLPSASVFGKPEFRFDDVDLVGFRLTLSRDSLPRLQKLADALNFHLTQPDAVADFRWKVATPTVILELLSYGKMKSRTPIAPLMADDFMSQHELIVRLLVGKVDDDGTQARDAAIFVPAIFVDNPVSKIAGRESQGMPKELAEFCFLSKETKTGGAEHRSVRPFPMTRAPVGEQAKQLIQVVRVRTPRQFGSAGEAALVDITYPDVMRHDDSSFERVDLSSILGSAVFSSSRWRQSDFGEREFRRSFAGHAMRDGFDRFRSVQVTPVDDRGLSRTWIHGNFTLQKLRVQFPTGVAVLKLSHEGRPSEDPWSILCDLLGADEISLPTGDWYRLRCAMDLSIGDSLDW